MDAESLNAVYGPEELSRIRTLVDLVAPPQTAATAWELPSDMLDAVEILISGWGGPVLDAAWLARLPRLQAVFYGAGSVSSLMPKEAWDRGVLITSAQTVNAIPVAEYTLAMVILSLKRVWRLAAEMKAKRQNPDRAGVPGCCERAVGLVALGAIGRAVADRLSRLDLTVWAHDPFADAADFDRLGVQLISLEDLFRKCDVISIHVPHLPSTEGLIGRAHLELMKPGATLINTSRGAVIREDDLVRVASLRGDLQFVLDVTREMPPRPSSPLYSLPNVMLTPHIAGSYGSECRRMGRFMVGQLERYVSGLPLQGRIVPEDAVNSSHHQALCPA